mmetsp:Transcript_77320/g.153493  ORF Transcript_77320/g.153493 Transcript_77320/m.153493 type:complete len:216 (-) Transcript_77320:303-950(-)
MADIYYSPVGTCVLIAKQVPPRPREDDGAVLGCELAPDVNESQLRSAIGPVVGLDGGLEGDKIQEIDITVQGGGAEAHIVFNTHESAVVATECAIGLPHGRGYLCLRYNDRPYNQRGWCVAEEFFSTECLLRLEMPKLARAKAIEIFSDSGPVTLQPAARRVDAGIQCVRNATFTGKGDLDVVQKIIVSHAKRIERLQARGYQASEPPRVVQRDL